MNIKISIIIPCYKSSATIKKCLNSLAGQTMLPYEVIAVNDASPDDTLQKLRQYNTSEKLNMKIVDFRENQGVSAARNAGIDAATGDFVMFLDSDDWLDTNCLGKLAQYQHEYCVDIVACNGVKTGANDSKIRTYQRKKTGQHLLNMTHMDDFIRHQAIFDSSCMKLYSLSMLNQNSIRFDMNIHYGEDTCFANTAAMSAKSIFVDYDFCGYFYFQNETSCMHILDLQHRLSELEAVILKLRGVYPAFAQQLLLRKCLEYVWTIKKYGSGQKNIILRSEIKKRIFQEIIIPTISTWGAPKYKFLMWFIRKEQTLALMFW